MTELESLRAEVVKLRELVLRNHALSCITDSLTNGDNKILQERVHELANALAEAKGRVELAVMALRQYRDETNWGDDDLNRWWHDSPSKREGWTLAAEALSDMGISDDN